MFQCHILSIHETSSEGILKTFSAMGSSYIKGEFNLQVSLGSLELTFE
jgi:hypothetical protein